MGKDGSSSNKGFIITIIVILAIAIFASNFYSSFQYSGNIAKNNEGNSLISSIEPPVETVGGENRCECPENVEGKENAWDNCKNIDEKSRCELSTCGYYYKYNEVWRIKTIKCNWNDEKCTSCPQYSGSDFRGIPWILKDDCPDYADKCSEAFCRYESRPGYSKFVMCSSE